MRVCVCEVEYTEVYFHYLLFITLPFSFLFFITEEVPRVGVPFFPFCLFFFFSVVVVVMCVLIWLCLADRLRSNELKRKKKN